MEQQRPLCDYDAQWAAGNVVFLWQLREHPGVWQRNITRCWTVILCCFVLLLGNPFPIYGEYDGKEEMRKLQRRMGAGIDIVFYYETVKQYRGLCLEAYPFLKSESDKSYDSFI